MKTYLFLLAALCSWGCQSTSQPAEQAAAEETLYLCTCEEDMSGMDSSVVNTKTQYLYLVYGGDTPDCCTNRLYEDYPGYRRVWVTEAPEHGGVWRNDSTDKMSAQQAQAQACAMENRVVAVADAERFPAAVQEHYPDYEPEK